MPMMKHKFEFLAGLYLGEELMFNNYTLKIEFEGNGHSPIDQNTALDRLTYFIFDVLQRSIFVCDFEQDVIDAYTKASIPVLTIPGPVLVDPLMVAVIVTKMNKILEGVLTISKAEISSYVGCNLVYVWDTAEENVDINGYLITDENMWWNDTAPRFTSYPTDRDLTDVEKEALFSTTWEDLMLGWLEADTAPTPKKKKKPKKKKGKIIKADFIGTDEK